LPVACFALALASVTAYGATLYGWQAARLAWGMVCYGTAEDAWHATSSADHPYFITKVKEAASWQKLSESI